MSSRHSRQLPSVVGHGQQGGGSVEGQEVGDEQGNSVCCALEVNTKQWKDQHETARNVEGGDQRNERVERMYWN